MRSATLEPNVPAAGFDALAAGIRPLGRVQAVGVREAARVRGEIARAYGATVTATAGDHGPTPRPPNEPRTT